MFNINKNSETKTLAETEAEVKQNVSNLVDNAKENMSDVASDVKASASNLGDRIQRQGEETKAEAYNVIDSLKSLLAQYTDSSRATHIKDQIVDKAVELKGVVQNEVGHAKDRTVQTVQDKPILSLAVALGAGVLLGYILGTKQNSDK